MFQTKLEAVICFFSFSFLFVLGFFGCFAWVAGVFLGGGGTWSLFGFGPFFSFQLLHIAAFGTVHPYRA